MMQTRKRKKSDTQRVPVVRRNNWMLKQSDYVVTYIIHSYGGAAQYAKKAKSQDKQVINI